MAKIVYSFVIPIYNEEDSLGELFKRMSSLLDRLDGPAEVILVNDGSRDQSYSIMFDLHKRDTRFKLVNLSRNFGHQIAITAGMDLTEGQATIVMDADLQDPPEVVLEMIKKWRDGFEVVYAVREKRKGETWFKKITAHIFYRFLDRLTSINIPKDVGDFRLVSRKALDAFKSMRETSRYVRGMFSWVGFKQTSVKFVREERFAGVTKYPLRKMLRFATDGVISFSNVPLRMVLKFGFFVSAVSFLFGILAIVLKLANIYTMPGWASLVVALSFMGGMQLLVMGVMGEYIGRIYEEVKDRPLYIVSDIVGIDPSNKKAPQAVIGD